MRFLGCFLVALICSFQVARAQSFNVDQFIDSEMRQAVIFLTVTGKTASGSEPKTSSGTGFMISKDGFAITAAHLFFANNSLNNESQRLWPASTSSFITGALGTAGGETKQFNLLNILPQFDVALIALKDPVGEHKFLSLCAEVPPLTENLTVLGFLYGQALVSPQARRAGGLIQAKFPFAPEIGPGMSGGPVLNDDGRVVGVGVTGVQAASMFSPSQFFSAEFTAQSRVKEDCGVQPPTVFKPDPFVEYSALITSGDEHFEKDLDKSFDYYMQARRLIQNRWEVHYGISRVKYVRQEYMEAVESAEEAQKFAPPDKLPLIWNLIGLSDDGLDELDAAKAAYSAILANVAPSDKQYRDALFSRAQIDLKLAMQARDQERDTWLNAAREQFVKFLDLGGRPSHFAHYHLACIAAIQNRTEDALWDLRRARKILNKYNKTDAGLQRSLLEARINNDVAPDAFPGSPVVCPDLVKVNQSKPR